MARRRAVHRIVWLVTALVTLVACGGSSDDAEPAVEQEEFAASGPDSPDCPVRNHLSPDFNGRTRRGVEAPTTNRTVSQPQRYGNRWAPVLIAWEHGDRFRMEPTNPAGGRAFAVEGVYVSGVLIVNIDAVADDNGRSRPANGFGEGTTWGRVFIHELAHILGLGHVGRSDQIMFPELGVQRGEATFQPGDLAGLRLLGREAGCLPAPAAPSGGPLPR